jgi:hypothetical protein
MREPDQTCLALSRWWTKSAPLPGKDAERDRNTFIMDAFSNQKASLGATLTGDPDKFGFGPIPASLQKIHHNHMHFQNTYPKPPKPTK